VISSDGANRRVLRCELGDYATFKFPPPVRRHLQIQILTLGRTTAEAKVGCFLLRMAERLSTDPTDALLLPISREDIADYLALSVETVSRSLTQLKRRGVIRLLDTRRIRIVDREALEEADRFTANDEKSSSDRWLNGPSEAARSSFAKSRA
jgi:hypothetical protein